MTSSETPQWLQTAGKKRELRETAIRDFVKCSKNSAEVPVCPAYSLRIRIYFF